MATLILIGIFWDPREKKSMLLFSQAQSGEPISFYSVATSESPLPLDPNSGEEEYIKLV